MGSQTPEAAVSSAKVLKIDHTGHVKVTLAWADEPIAAADEWPTVGGEDAVYALSVVAHVDDRVVSSEDEEETTAAPAAGDEDSASEHGLYGIAPGSPGSSKPDSDDGHSGSHGDEEEEEEEEDDGDEDG